MDGTRTSNSAPSHRSSRAQFGVALEQKTSPCLGRGRAKDLEWAQRHWSMSGRLRIRPASAGPGRKIRPASAGAGRKIQSGRSAKSFAPPGGVVAILVQFASCRRGPATRIALGQRSVSQGRLQSEASVRTSAVHCITYLHGEAGVRLCREAFDASQWAPMQSYGWARAPKIIIWGTLGHPGAPWRNIAGMVGPPGRPSTKPTYSW